MCPHIKQLTSRTFFSIALICAFVAVTPAQMKMHVINVGQGESVLFEFTNQAVLVDAGSHKPEDAAHLFEYLDAFFARRSDLDNTLHSVVVSHAHIDHTRNLKAVFERYNVLHLVEGGAERGSGVHQLRTARTLITGEPGALHKISARNVKRPWFLRAWTEELKTGSQVDIKFLSAGRKCNNENNASLVMRVEHKGKKFLLTGDAEEDDKEGRSLGCGGLLFRLLSDRAAFPQLLNVDVLKVAHHASRNGTIEQFLLKVKPDYAVISAGDNRLNQNRGSFSAWDHGHPNELAVTRLEQSVRRVREPKTVTIMAKAESDLIEKLMRKAIYSTGWDGDIVFTVDGSGELSVETTAHD